MAQANGLLAAVRLSGLGIFLNLISRLVSTKKKQLTARSLRQTHEGSAFERSWRSPLEWQRYASNCFFLGSKRFKTVEHQERFG
jgi:hypothetical protein